MSDYLNEELVRLRLRGKLKARMSKIHDGHIDVIKKKDYWYIIFDDDSEQGPYLNSDEAWIALGRTVLWTVRHLCGSCF